MPALIQDRKHTCKTLEYQSLSLWCHRQLGQLVLHVLHARAAWIGVLPCTFVLMPIVCKRRGSVLMGHKVPPTKPRVPPGPGEVELGPVGYWHGSWGQWATGTGAGASLHRCAAPAPWGNTAQEKQLPHVKRELPELAATGQNSQAASVRRAQIILQFLSVC